MQHSRLGLFLKYARRNRWLFSARKALIILTVLAAYHSPAILSDLRLEREGIVATAFVEGKLSPRGRRGGIRYSLQYAFTVDGQPYGRDEPVSKELWQTVKLFGPLAVLYLPSAPQVCRAGPPAWETMSRIWLGIAVVALAILVIGLLKGAWEVASQLRLILRGVPVLGRVTLVDKSPDRVEYAYLAPVDGAPQLLEVAAAAIPLWYKEVTVGNVVLVMHDATNPRRSEIDWFDAREDERLALMQDAARQARMSS